MKIVIIGGSGLIGTKPPPSAQPATMSSPASSTGVDTLTPELAAEAFRGAYTAVMTPQLAIVRKPQPVEVLPNSLATAVAEVCGPSITRALCRRDRMTNVATSRHNAQSNHQDSRHALYSIVRAAVLILAQSPMKHRRHTVRRATGLPADCSRDVSRAADVALSRSTESSMLPGPTSYPWSISSRNSSTQSTMRARQSPIPKDATTVERSRTPHSPPSAATHASLQRVTIAGSPHTATKCAHHSRSAA